MPHARELLDLPLRDLLDEIAAESPTPGGGSAAAVAVALGAALLAMTARASTESWPEAAGAAAQAELLRAKAAPLAQADAAAYGEALRLLRAPTGDRELAHALDLAADLPLRIAQVAEDVAELGTLVAERADPALRPDAAAAVLLAESAARIAAQLIRVNLSTTPGDERLTRAEALADAAAKSARRALGNPTR